jgi:hypothetical protein
LQQNKLCARLRELNLALRFAVAVPRDRTWFEGFSVVSGLDDEQAVDLACASGQPAAIRWDSDSLVILSSGLADDISTSTTGWQLESSKVSTCPVRKDADPVGRCPNFGGPYGSTAIHAAALWRAHRKVALALLGCGPCADGSERIWGSPRGGTISLAEEIIGSRYGGYTWRP